MDREAAVHLPVLKRKLGEQSAYDRTFVRSRQSGYPAVWLLRKHLLSLTIRRLREDLAVRPEVLMPTFANSFCIVESSLSLRLLSPLVLGSALLASTVTRAETPADSGQDYINPDRPGIADGSNVVGAGRFQVEAGFQQEYRRNSGGSARTAYLPTLLRLGVNKSWEVRVEGNTYTLTKVYDAERNRTQIEGVQPASVGLKYQFSESAGWQHPSMGAIVRLFPASGSGNFTTKHMTGDFRIAADWDFAPRWSLNPNLGVAAYEDDGQRLYTAGLLAMTLNYNPSKVLNLFIDIGAQYPETKRGRGSATVDCGVAYIIGRDVQLDFSVGARVTGEMPARRFWAAGISKRI